jgi:hypothetical protein
MTVIHFKIGSYEGSRDAKTATKVVPKIEGFGPKVLS